MTPDQFRTRFTWDTDPITCCWTNINGERLRNTDPKYLPLASLRRDEGAYRVKGESGISQRIHRLAYETFIGPCELAPRQTCGNPLCFNPDHLKPLGRNGWKRTALCKCQMCGEMKPREEIREVGKRHYVCKGHREEAQAKSRAMQIGRNEMCKEKERKKSERIANRKSPEERRLFENKKRVAYMKAKYKSDPAFYALVCCRRRVSNLIKSKGIDAPYRTLELIGCCSADFLMHHIESQFKHGMTWDNKGKWHIDHIRPCASFDLTDPEQQKECFHWTNLRPIWAKHNYKKRDHWDGQLDMTHALVANH